MKHIEKITKYFKAIQELDKNIIQLEKLGNNILGDENILHFSFLIESLTAEAEALKEESPYSFPGLFNLYSSIGEKKKSGAEEKFKLDSRTALIIVSVMIKCFQEKREEFIKAIELLTIKSQ